MMSNSNCPCNGCVPPKRYPGCHGGCEEYKSWNEEHIRHNRELYIAKAKDKLCDDYTIDEMSKNAKKRREIEKHR